MTADPRRRFTAAASDYHRHRPSYPTALVEWIEDTARLPRPTRIADVGCGTGVSTRLFAARGHDVVGVDPNAEMLAYAREAGGARYVEGEAIATGLPAASVDLVTVAQAFHWFEVEPTLRELRRILEPGGACAAFWNLRVLEGPFLDEYERLLKAQSEEYETLPKADAAMRAIRASSEIVSLAEAEFPNAQLFDREGLFGRAHSSSYVAHGVRDRAAFDGALGELYERHQREGRVEFRYRSVALLWRFRT